MMRKSIFFLFALMIPLAACVSSESAPQSIERYIQSLAEKDVVAATNASCLDWEESAFAEASSFEAVEVTIEGLSCNEAGVQNEFTLVTCNGKIIANYGGEIQAIDLSLRTYLALFEQGEWKMCGYSAN